MNLISKIKSVRTITGKIKKVERQKENLFRKKKRNVFFSKERF